MSYKPADVDVARDVKNFSCHPATGDQGERYEKNRTACLGLATLLRMNCPASRELSLAITHLEQVMFFADAAISRNE